MQRFLHDVQCRQHDGLLRRVMRQVFANPLPRCIAQQRVDACRDQKDPPRCLSHYRSSSAAMMFKLPSTATTSDTVWPWMSWGKMAKWTYDGGRQRARYAVMDPSATT